MKTTYFTELTTSGKQVAKNLLANDSVYHNFTAIDHHEAYIMHASRCNILGDQFAFAHSAIGRDLLSEPEPNSDVCFANNPFQLLFMERVIKKVNRNQFGVYKPLPKLEKCGASIQKVYVQLQALLLQ